MIKQTTQHCYIVQLQFQTQYPSSHQQLLTFLFLTDIQDHLATVVFSLANSKAWYSGDLSDIKDNNNQGHFPASTDSQKKVFCTGAFNFTEYTQPAARLTTSALLCCKSRPTLITVVMSFYPKNNSSSMIAPP